MTKQQRAIVSQASSFLQDRYQNDSSGHDWWHLERVWRNAKVLARGEKVDHFLIEMAALLHDVDDSKVKPEGEKEFARTEPILQEFQITAETKEKLYVIIRTVSFHGGFNASPTSLEGSIVQDADRLDAIGAIGIARCFAYNGNKGSPIYDPTMEPKTFDSFSWYRKHTSTAINHFYEKLLLLKDRMNTPQAQKIAEHRHRVLEEYLKEFFAEVEGRR
ncbi:HD domain-containing protein [Candidatus Gottesmanbacteria bacterium]|nr:HD domain-containing protein [Candidatus Gottesmanbacteria bacterium]